MMFRLGLAALVASMVATAALADSSSYTALTGKPLPTITGDVSLGFGPAGGGLSLASIVGSGTVSSSFSLLKGDGRVNIPFDERWNFEFETAGESQWNSTGSTSAFGAYGHLWARSPATALGVFGGVNSTTLGLENVAAGIEGEAYLGNVTLGGQASASWNTVTFAGFSTSFDSWQLRAYADYYLTANDKITGEVKYTDPPSAGLYIPSQHTWEFLGRAEHRFAGTLWSIWGSGSYMTGSGANSIASFTQSRWTALVGFRLFMDSPGSTLQGHDREVPFDYDNHNDLFWFLYRPIV